ncbi:TIR domain-containing protein [Lentzea sp. BCCO 10_0856]|uniref:TIR domain-containing protein n=1 Tax=Lentzea miocenica TaxID=3095431 RepID=A0ABU4SVI0_9PSEU|nr:TIR domain-containing protein [Lentzea sp. BCCO 10_0856]MDX8029902.1 TIR domain-containing protein [Lentzea sp. BCCO 10_0856]
MTVFISHSFDNKPEFANVTESLDRLKVPYWRPAEIKTGGASLRDQLRAAVQTCSVCVFIATHASVKSSWCGAELGAFWGAGTPIIVYVADSSLPEKHLPPILQGDAWERTLAVVASRAAELVSHDQSGAYTAPQPSTLVSNMNASQLEKVVTGALSLALAQAADEPAGINVETAASEATGRTLRARATVGLLGEDPEDDWKRRILWVDDHPGNNQRERKVFESFGIEFTLARSTREALSVLDERRFGAIISDMGRAEGPDEGFALLNEVRSRDLSTPFFLYTGVAARQHRLEASARGAQGVTNMAAELVDMVTAALGKAV